MLFQNCFWFLVYFSAEFFPLWANLFSIGKGSQFANGFIFLSLLPTNNSHDWGSSRLLIVYCENLFLKNGELFCLLYLLSWGFSLFPAPYVSKTLLGFSCSFNFYLRFSGYKVGSIRALGGDGFLITDTWLRSRLISFDALSPFESCLGNLKSLCSLSKTLLC